MSEGALEVRGDREVVRRDLPRANQIQPQRIVGAEPGVEPEPPGEVYVAGIVGQAIRPHEVWSQMERPGGGVGADTPILQGGHLGRRARMNQPLRAPVEERQVQRLVDYIRSREPPS